MPDAYQGQHSSLRPHWIKITKQEIKLTAWQGTKAENAGQIGLHFLILAETIAVPQTEKVTWPDYHIGKCGIHHSFLLKQIRCI